DVEQMAAIVACASKRQYPRFPLINGFCFMTRRDVIETIGCLDEENFTIGYGEEADHCILAIDAGFEIAIADDVYVFHAKSRSFGHGRRKALTAKGIEALMRKHGPEKYRTTVSRAKRSTAMDEIRYLVQSEMDVCSPERRGDNR